MKRIYASGVKVLVLTVMVGLSSSCVFERYQRIFHKYKIVNGQPERNGVYSFVSEISGVEYYCTAGSRDESDTTFVAVGVKLRSNANELLYLNPRECRLVLNSSGYVPTDHGKENIEQILLPPGQTQTFDVEFSLSGSDAKESQILLFKLPGLHIGKDSIIFDPVILSRDNDN